MSAAASNALAARLLTNVFGATNGVLTIGGVSVRDIAAKFGTPVYVYDAAQMRCNFVALCDAVAGFADIFYSIKANPNPAVARVFVELGAGLEIASGREFENARAAGCAPENILFAGPGKSETELAAALRAGLGEVHAESFEEIAALGAIARQQGRRVNVAIRINPVAAVQGGAMRMGGKPAAFGFDEEILEDVVAAIAREEALDITGVHLFAGTQVLDAAVLLKQWAHGIDLAARLASLIRRPLHTIDLGGGLGVPYYAAEADLDIAAVKAGVGELIAAKAQHALLKDARVLLEPGRYLVGNAGIYLAATRAVKTSRGARFVITDGGMHHHLAASGNLGQVVKRDYPIVAADKLDAEAEGQASVVGPLCTPLDTLGRQVNLPAMQRGDLVAILQSGAYGLSASPVGFLSHPLPREVLVDKGQARDISATR